MKNETEYLLDCLQEECAEIIQIVSKIKRFGLHEVWPDKARNPERLSNEERLNRESNDYIATMELLQSKGVRIFRDTELVGKKWVRLRKYMDYSRQQGLLEPET